MSEPGVGSAGGPQWLHTAKPSADRSPAVVGDALPPTTFAGATGVQVGSADALFTARYSRSGVSPLPFMVVSLVAMAATWWALGWAESDPSAPDPVRSSEWWTNVTAVMLPSESLGQGAYSSSRLWVALSLLLLAGLSSAVWIGRIGSNIRSGQGPFGAFLPIAALPAWWALPISVGLTSDATRSRGDLLIRFLLALALLLGQYVLLRWPLLNRTWRAGHLPYDVAAIGLWLPSFIPWAMIFASTSLTLMLVDEDDPLSDSPWQPTEAMADWATWTTRACGLGILALLVVVSIAQHVGMRKDRADDRAARER